MSELLEKILSNDNMNVAYKRVCINKGAGGVDYVSASDLKGSGAAVRYFADKDMAAILPESEMPV